MNICPFNDWTSPQNPSKRWENIWEYGGFRFVMGLPLVLIQFEWDFPVHKNPPASLGAPWRWSRQDWVAAWQALGIPGDRQGEADVMGVGSSRWEDRSSIYTFLYKGLATGLPPTAGWFLGKSSASRGVRAGDWSACSSWAASQGLSRWD